MINEEELKFRVEKFKSIHGDKIDISTPSELEEKVVNATTFTYIPNYLEKNNINTGEFLFGFENSLLFYERGFFSRNRKKIYPYTELKNCGFKEKGTLVKQKRLVLYLRHNDFNLDIFPYDSVLDENVLSDLKYIFGLSSEQIQSEKERETKLFIEIGDVIKLNKEIIYCNEKIQLKYLSCIIEHLLNNIPITLEYTLEISSKLKLIQNEFNDSQINKLTRFLTFLEGYEKNYNDLYSRGVQEYQINPKNEIFRQLPDYYCSILNYYQIFIMMLNNVSSDKIIFNKFYNIIEDEGIFMTRNEKESMEYLKTISNNIGELNNTLISGFNKLNNTLENISHDLNDINSGIILMDSSLSIIHNSIHDIYLNM